MKDKIAITKDINFNTSGYSSQVWHLAKKLGFAIYVFYQTQGIHLMHSKCGSKRSLERSKFFVRPWCERSKIM